MDVKPPRRVGEPLHSRRQFAMDFTPAPRMVVQTASTSVKHVSLPIITTKRRRVPKLARGFGLRVTWVWLHLANNKYAKRYAWPLVRKADSLINRVRVRFIQSSAGQFMQKWAGKIWNFAKRVTRPVMHNPVTRFIKNLPPLYKKVALGVLAVAIMLGGYVYIHNQQYHLSIGEQQLLAKPSVDLKMIKTTKDGFTYNHTDEQHKDGFDAVVAASQADSSGKFPYQVTLPKNPSKGIKFASSDGSLGFTMTPMFTTAGGREQDGRVLYPEGMNSVHSYTFKRNGVKEDIVLSKAPGSDTYTKSWKLNLGDKLEAHMLPSGGVGIYSASQMLSGNVTASSPADQKLLDAARKNGKKDNLEFVIPAPYITYATGAPQYSGVKFALKNDVLTLTVTGMKNRAYPLSIDPTLVVTTTSDFQQGTDDDGMIDWSTSGQINRADIGYGTPSSFNQQTSAFTTGRYGNESVIYKGYLYIIGGLASGGATGCDANGYCNDISYCPINSDGSVGSCTQQLNAFTTTRFQFTTDVYNGYLYIMGGQTGTATATGCPSNNYCNDIQYCPFNANGSVGACTQELNAFTSQRRALASTVYNGYLYISTGISFASATGCNASGLCGDVQYCPIEGDGSVGACTQQLSVFTANMFQGAALVAYNGYLELTGGWNGSVYNQSLFYCPINSNGSVGTCTLEGTTMGTRMSHKSVAYNGYLYVIGGTNGSWLNDISYCPFNANGSVGTCTNVSNAFTNARYDFGAAINNGYLYIAGGHPSSNVGQNDILYGLLGKYGSVALTTQQTNAFTTARDFHTSVVYNGYLYILGGNASGTYQNGVQYCPINSTGSVGTCTATTSFTIARTQFASVAYNGYLYITGGVHSTSDTACNPTANTDCSDIEFVPINANGTLGTWHYTHNSIDDGTTFVTSGFTTARDSHASVAYNGYLYIIGGVGGSFLNTIQYCPFNSNGTVGTCTANSTGFTTGRYGLTAAADNGTLYIIGGTSNGSNGLNDIQHCPINSNGTVSTCVVQSSAFTTGREGHASAIYNGYLYITGGSTNGGGIGGFLNDLIFCPLNSNGSVGTCTTELNAFTTARYGHTSVAYNGYLYIVGGYGGSAQNDIQYLPIVGGQVGDVGSGTQQTNAFTTPRYGQSTALYNGYIYIAGGYGNSFVLQTSVYYCPLNANGSVGTCTATTSLGVNQARAFHASVAYNGYLYLIGGASFVSVTGCDSNGECNDILYSPIASNGTIGAWTQQTAAFTTTRDSASASVNNGYLYIVGGNNPATGGALNDIEYCPVNSNGSVGTCTSQTTVMTNGRYGEATFIYNSLLYIVGGGTGFVGTSCNTTNAYCNDIQHCTLNSNGSVGTCTRQTEMFPAYRVNLTAVVSGGYIYIMGGANGITTTPLNDVVYCPINSDGSVGTCNEKGNSTITNGRVDHSSVAYNGFVYLIGGQTNASSTGCTTGAGTTWYCNDIQYFDTIDRGFGSGGSSTQQTNAFTTARQYHSSVVYNGYMYIIGGTGAASASGCDSSGYCNDIQYCPINSNGSVGSCTQQLNAFTTTRYGHTSVVYNGYLYIIGGLNNASVRLNDIQYCPINSNGSVGSCTQQTNAFTTARYSHSSVVYNGYLYIIGGSGSGTGCNAGNFCNDIQYCPINSNGSVGSCTQQLNAFNIPRVQQSAAVYNGYVYIIGGSDANGKYDDDIQYCPLNANGSVGTCTEQSSIFAIGRYLLTSVAANGYLYILGGYNNSGTYQNDMQYCAINSNGSVSSCNRQTNAFTNGRQGHTSVVWNGYVYVIGGFAPSTLQNDIQRIPLTNPDQSSNYEKVMNIGSVAGLVASFVINGTAACNLRVDYELADGSGVFGSTTTLLNAKVGTTYSINAINQQYVWFKVYMDDSTCGGRTSITDITLTYGFAPSAPTLIAPANATVGTSLTPQFQLRSSDASGVDWARYKIFVCSDSLCNTVIRTIDQTASQTGWTGQDSQTSTAYVTNSVLTSSTIAKHTYQAPPLSAGTQYWWEAQAIDPGDTNQWGPLSSISTFTTQSVPAAPTLSAPAAGATGVSTLPVFQLRTTDVDGDYLKYKILVCSTSNCSSVVRTIDQTASQTGWSGQDQQAGTAYTGNAVITSSTMATHTYQAAALSFGTQYWWEAFAIDPGGSNTFSSASAIQTFTTTSPPNAPTLVSPLTTGTLLSPIFQMVATDPDGDYLKYKFDLCSTSNCSSIITTINQVSSQTGWQDQDQQSATAYSSGRTTRYQWQGTNLTPNTQYWWRAYAIDPAGTNTFGTVSSIGTFTTGQVQSVLRGGSIIKGGTIVQ